MLRLEFKVSTSNLQKLLNSFQYRTDCDYWESNKYFTYRHQFTFRVDLKNSYTLLADFIDARKDANKIIILEFNPNKVGSDLGLLSLLNKLCLMAYKKRLVRFDCAIDIPVSRDRCLLVKDQRTYSEYRNSSSDLTQYLGHRNKHGFVKLYNKARELGLSDDNLTRLEITVDGDKINEVESIFPKVYVINDQIDFDDGINSTDRVLMFACMDNPSYLSLLERRRAKKIKELIDSHSLILSLDSSLFDSVCRLAFGFLNSTVTIVEDKMCIVNSVENPFAR